MHDGSDQFHQAQQDAEINMKRKKFSRYFFGGLSILIIIGIIVTAVRLTSEKNYNTNQFGDDDQEAPPMIFVAGIPEHQARAAAFEGKRELMLPPPPLSNYEEKPLIHINTDKPYYQPNEIVFIEAFFVDAISKKPIFARQDTMYPQLRYEPYSYLDVHATA